MHMVI